MCSVSTGVAGYVSTYRQVQVPLYGAAGAGVRTCSSGAPGSEVEVTVHMLMFILMFMLLLMLMLMCMRMLIFGCIRACVS